MVATTKKSPGNLFSDALTDGIRVKAIAQFVPERSNPDAKSFFFTYRIKIANEGDQWARLQSRHWIIINAEGDREDVRGPGVVGQTPALSPGEEFEYTSFCPLNTEWGTMEGTFRMERKDGTPFNVRIDRFYLTTTVQVLNPVV